METIEIIIGEVELVQLGECCPELYISNMKDLKILNKIKSDNIKNLKLKYIEDEENVALEYKEDLLYLEFNHSYEYIALHKTQAEVRDKGNKLYIELFEDNQLSEDNNFEDCLIEFFLLNNTTHVNEIIEGNLIRIIIKFKLTENSKQIMEQCKDWDRLPYIRSFKGDE